MPAENRSEDPIRPNRVVRSILLQQVQVAARALHRY
jgi:hypothetical protein